LFKKWPYPKRIRIVSETKLVEEGGPIDTEIKTWWPEGKYEGFQNGKLYVSQFKTDNGWIVDKMTYQQKPREFEGATLGVVDFREPPPEDIYNACVGRMRRGGIILMSFTPLHSAAWIADRLVDSHDNNSVMVNADIEANCREHGVRGILEHRDIERMIQNWDPEEREARATGKFMHLSKVIFGGAFKRAFHVIPNDVEPPADAQWGVSVDPANGKPWAIGVFWVDRRGQIVFDSEYPDGDFTKLKESYFATPDYVNVINSMTAGKQVEWRIIDRHFANERDHNHSTLKKALGELGLDFQNSYNSEEEIKTGIQSIKDYLRFDDSRPIDGLNYPRLMVKERCKNIIRGFERWCRDERGEPERLSPYKDHIDLVRYAVCAKPEVYERRPAPERRAGYVLGSAA
jgi:phage terminase large subunit-like protein